MRRGEDLTLAATIASTNTALISTIKREQAAYLRLGHHFDSFQLDDISGCPRVAATLAALRQTISTHASRLKPKPATATAPSSRPPPSKPAVTSSQRPSSWASVAGRSAPPVPLPSRRPVSVSQPLPTQSSKTATDLRVMIRLPPESPSRQLTAGALLTQARQIVAGDAVIRNVQFVRSGIALQPYNESARAQLLAHHTALQQYFGASAIESQAAASRDTYILPYAPIMGSLAAYAEELSAILSTPVLSARIAPNNTADTGTLFVERLSNALAAGYTIQLVAALVLPPADFALIGILRHRTPQPIRSTSVPRQLAHILQMHRTALSAPLACPMTELLLVSSAILFAHKPAFFA
ncbi:hypothetical protein KEM55_004927 [Ascosphaera atra]|nr:hypothetical protein KEM55_004927 [Ascosphaera atra]